MLSYVRDVRDISPVAKLLKDTDYKIELNAYNNFFYNESYPNVIKLNNLTIPAGTDMSEDIEVWIVVDDYVSYSVNDK